MTIPLQQPNPQLSDDQLALIEDHALSVRDALEGTPSVLTLRAFIATMGANIIDLMATLTTRSMLTNKFLRSFREAEERGHGLPEVQVMEFDRARLNKNLKSADFKPQMAVRTDDWVELQTLYARVRRLARTTTQERGPHGEEKLTVNPALMKELCDSVGEPCPAHKLDGENA